MKYDMQQMGISFLAILTSALIAIGWSNSLAQDAPEWSQQMFDPAVTEYSEADLVLPMPCGGAMAFQQVDVVVDDGSALSDRRVRLGTPESNAKYSEYLRLSHLRGAFTGSAPNKTHYYIGRYELTAMQEQALRGSCPEPTIQGRLPATNLSWFDAVELARNYTEWLQQNAARSIPEEDGALGFVRLPTEEEWEYAARGGAKVEPTVFSSRRFPMDENIDDVAWHQGNARGSARPVGLRAPNPLGLFDIYGNAAELVLDSFRMNARGREHGQLGGVTTRGGSFQSAPAQLYSAKRNEWPAYSVTKQRATALTTFGTRFVISTHISVTDQRVTNLQDGWESSFVGDTGNVDDPLAELARIIEQETDQTRVADLNKIRHIVLTAQDRANSDRRDRLKSALMSGATFVLLIRETDRGAKFNSNIESVLTKRIESPSTKDDVIDLITPRLDQVKRNRARETQLRDTTTSSYARLLDSLVGDEDPELLQEVRDMLRDELQGTSSDQIRTAVDDFYQDVQSYREVPESTMEEIRRLAID